MRQPDPWPCPCVRQVEKERAAEDEHTTAATKIESDIDPIKWKTELERVGPKLKVASRIHPHS